MRIGCVFKRVKQPWVKCPSYYRLLKPFKHAHEIIFQMKAEKATEFFLGSFFFQRKRMNEKVQ